MNAPLTINKSDSWKMFDEISPRYDFLNHLLSFGLDIHWRNNLIRYLPRRNSLKILDLATGTADVLLSLCKNNPNILSGVGVDLADKMLELGRAKIHEVKLDQKITLKHGDAHELPFPNESFDAVTIAFGIRNMEDPAKVMREMYRVLKNSGRAIILEFSLPKNNIIKNGHLFYLRHIVPNIGGFVSGHKEAYRYLNQTIESFPYGKEFCQLLEAVGFKNPQAHPLMAGIASIYVGEKI